MRKDFNDFTNVYEIDINKDFVNQIFQTTISGISFKIEIRTMNKNILIEIKKGDDIIVPMHTVKTLWPLNITTFYKFNSGYFFVTGNKNNEVDLASYNEMRLFYGVF